MKKLFKLISANLILIGISLAANAQQSDFSGTWKRNNTLSDAGELSINSIPIQIISKQDGKSVSIERTSVTGAGVSTTYIERLNFDCSQTKTQVRANFNKIASVKWSDDRRSLLLNAEYSDDQGNKVTGLIEKWSLSADGKQLTIDRTDTDNDGVFTLTEIFDRQ